jgi:predicted AAA+ superfamily ATPase
MIKRKLFDSLKDHLSKPEITLIVGPRQAGKTTLMRLLEEELKRKGMRTLFFNLDIETDKEYFTSQARLIKKIELELGKKRGFVFIDEIQRKEDAGLFLKGIYDMGLPYKFIVSGSGSVELKEKIKESLAGRKRVFELTTLTFEEFVNYRTAYRYEERLQDFFSVEERTARELLEEYLNFGGYPRVVLNPELSEKEAEIKEIYQSYIEKDISYLLRIHKIDEFSRLVKILARETGKPINLSDLSNTLGISVKTLKYYLWYLEKTFIIQMVTPFFSNIRKELTKSPVCYFYDLGLLNFASGIFGRLQDHSYFPLNGFVFQNLIYNLLKEGLKDRPSKIYFWRTKDGAEIDFVIDDGRKVIPVETKYKPFKSPEVTRSMRSFIEKYKPELALVINLSLEDTLTINTTELRFLPYYKLLWW